MNNNKNAGIRNRMNIAYCEDEKIQLEYVEQLIKKWADEGNGTVRYFGYGSANKLTVGKKYRNLVLPMQEIKEISWKWIVFPIATVNMKNGKLYKFIIFNKSRFAKWFQEYSR